MLYLVTLVVGLSLQDATDGAIAAFKEAIKAALCEDDKIAAIKKLGEVRTARTAGVLAQLLTQDSDNVRIEAARALAGFTEVSGTARVMAPALIHSSNGRRRDVRIEIVKALESLAQPDALMTLYHVIQRDKDFQVVKAAVESLPTYKHVSSIPVLLEALKKAEDDPPDVVVDVDIPSLPKNPGDPQPGGESGGFSLGMNVTEEQKLRHQILYEPILATLRKMTRQGFSTWKFWSRWWLENAGRFRFPEE